MPAWNEKSSRSPASALHMARTFASAHLPENGLVAVGSVVVVGAEVVAAGTFDVIATVLARTNLYDVALVANTVESHVVP